MRSRKYTAWKKSRKFGDIKGGRQRPKMDDNIFRKLHSLKPPASDQETPILLEENPSRNFFFPLSGAQFLEALEALPNRQVDGITHLWLRRNLTGGRAARQPLAEFICGSGVRVIVLYPWRRDLHLCLGREKPDSKAVASYSACAATPFRSRGWWYIKFTREQLKLFYVQHLLYHEVGHHVDWYFRHWSKANRKKIEEFADQFAFQKARTANHVIRKFNTQTT